MMGSEEVEIDGQLITVQMPVGNIQVSDKQVTYSDASGASTCTFSSPDIAQQFADWLQTQSR
ncbi:hypothetical protein [Alteromonas antoniana]|uniref:hypothetical protein n=1 Tax=Alteromonas antoniana TaxID=2803813 RepID=UPI001C43A949|nr:hypothetical protein [Alteromonas antoniana]